MYILEGPLPQVVQGDDGKVNLCLPLGISHTRKKRRKQTNRKTKMKEYQSVRISGTRKRENFDRSVCFIKVQRRLRPLKE